MKIVLWFRRDLRIHDQILIEEANKSDAEFLGFAQAELDAVFQNTSEVRWGERKKQFYLESVADIKGQFERKGIPFWFSDLPLIKALAELEKTFCFDEIWCQNTAGWEEQEELSWVAKKYKLHRFESQSLYQLEDLPFELKSLPLVFTEFRKKVERYSTVKKSCSSEICFRGAENAITPALPAHPTLAQHPNSAFPFSGGEQSALNRMEEWIWKGNHIAKYKETRNESIGTEYSSKFSSYLAWGCLSPRAIFWEIKKYEQEVVANESTYWLYFELLWRDFFHFTCRKDNRAFFKSMPSNLFKEPEAFKAWKEGKTENAFINAHMIELAATGFMSNRGRQNVASYLIHHLKLDWWLGAQHFERELIDYEAANNYGNWTYLAGVGNDPRKDRIFNPELQKQRYDPQGKYVALWT